MNNFSGIYGIRSISHPDRIYIGSSIDIKKRWRRHIEALEKRKHHSSQMQYHYNKYGEGDFVFEVILKCDIADLIKTEQLFLDIYRPYFNVCRFAGSSLGIKHSKESIEKMRSAQKNRAPISEDTREKISRAGIGRSPSDETRKKISESNKGKCFSKTTRQKMSKAWEERLPFSDITKLRMRRAHIGKHFTKEHKKNLSKNNGKSRPVINLETGIFYESITMAAISINKPSAWLVNRLSGHCRNITMFRYV